MISASIEETSNMAVLDSSLGEESLDEATGGMRVHHLVTIDFRLIGFSSNP